MRKTDVDATMGRIIEMIKSTSPFVSCFLLRRSSNPQRTVNIKKAPPVIQYRRTEMITPNVIRIARRLGIHLLNRFKRDKLIINAKVMFK
jgi:hypothetical protein